MIDVLIDLLIDFFQIDWVIDLMIWLINWLNDWFLKVPKSKEEKTLSADEGKALCKEEKYICLMFMLYIL